MPDKVNREPGEIITIDEFGRRKFVVSSVHKGGMGVVYQLLPITPSWNAIALKTYQDETLLEDFKKEARIWFSLSGHPNIAQPIWYGLCDQQFSILAEWYPHCLDNFQVSFSNVENFHSLTIKIIEGLKYAYLEHGVIHRDLKPSNVLLTESLVPKISDFGISVLTKEKFGLLAGTYKYMAPELFVGWPASIRTDIYALGVTLFEILTRKSFDKSLGVSERKKILQDLGRTLGPGISAINNLILACTESEPCDRSSDYSELLGILGGATHHSNVSTTNDMAVTAYANILFKQDKADQAISILKTYLEKEPNNSMILSTLGILYAKMNNYESAKIILGMACNVIRSSKLINRKSIFPEPFVNLAMIFIFEHKFEYASETINQLNEIINLQKSFEVDIYPELGWHRLYNGDFDKSTKLLLSAFKSRKPNIKNIEWLILSTYLSGNFRQFRNTLYRILIDGFSVFDVETALFALLVTDVLEGVEQDILHKKILTDCYLDLQVIADAHGFSYGLERLPLTTAVKSAILNSLDYDVTGGKFHGNIQQSLESTLA